MVLSLDYLKEISITSLVSNSSKGLAFVGRVMAIFATKVYVGAQAQKAQLCLGPGARGPTRSVWRWGIPDTKSLNDNPITPLLQQYECQLMGHYLSTHIDLPWTMRGMWQAKGTEAKDGLYKGSLPHGGWDIRHFLYLKIYTLFTNTCTGDVSRRSRPLIIMRTFV